MFRSNGCVFPGSACCTVFGEAHVPAVLEMIPVSVVVCVMGGWCSVYLADTLLRVKSDG